MPGEIITVGMAELQVAGGAQMFSCSSDSRTLQVGKRNTEAVCKALSVLSVPVPAKDVGGRNSRTIEFLPETGTLKVRTANLKEMEI